MKLPQVVSHLQYTQLTITSGNEVALGTKIGVKVFA
jgi:hypothetical protein